MTKSEIRKCINLLREYGFRKKLKPMNIKWYGLHLVFFYYRKGTRPHKGITIYKLFSYTNWNYLYSGFVIYFKKKKYRVDSFQNLKSTLMELL